ncbi:MAG: beta-sandwich domain-containing protein [Thermoanaerobaculales bacterium]
MRLLADSNAAGAERYLRTAAVAVCLSVASAIGAQAGGAISGKVDATPAKYLEETVVYLKGAPAHPAPKTINLDQKGKTFLPHLLVVTVGDTVAFLNHDTIAHNVYSPDNETYNLGNFKPEESRTYTFKTAGMYTQLCSLHPEMLAYIFVGENPYSAAVGKDGSFTIRDVPPGSYTIAVWNSHLKVADKKVTVSEGKGAEVSFSLKR